MKLEKSNIENIDLELKYELKLEWLNFLIYKYIDTISYSRFIIGDITIQLLYKNNEGKISISKQNIKLDDLNNEVSYKRNVNLLNGLAKSYLKRMSSLIFSAKDKVVITKELKGDYSIKLLTRKSEKLKKYSGLDEYFNDIEKFIARQNVSRENMVPFCK